MFVFFFEDMRNMYSHKNLLTDFFLLQYFLSLDTLRDEKLKNGK